jgi:transposase
MDLDSSHFKRTNKSFVSISDVFGVSGRNLLGRLIEQGHVDTVDIDECVKGSIKNKKGQVADSLFGTMTPHQMELIRDCWEHIEFLEKSIDHMEPYRKEYELLQTIPGVSISTAAVLIAEIGVDMNQFPSAEYLSSWAGVAPGNHESAGKKKYKERKRQFSRKSGIMRSGMGNRSL